VTSVLSGLLPRRALVLVAVAVVLVGATAAGDGGVVLAGEQALDYPSARDFVAIEQVPARPPDPAAGPGASTGSWVSRCGRNENGHYNRDNLVASPGRPGLAQHTHDYVGNVATSAFSTEKDLARAATTCRNGDTSTYYWPVVQPLATAEHAGPHGAAQRPAPLLPASVLVRFGGNPRGKVFAMPRFLRVVTGNAKALTQPVPGLPAAQWTCSGATDRRTPRYPLCPPGERVVRIFDYPSCWDGVRLDSPTHRAHVVFPAGNGACPAATFPIPQLRVELSYSVPPGRSYAIDTLPEQRRSPLADHADFINVMPDPMMARLVDCLNSGRHC
jgi:Domain of unknown function (DUF1996)